MISRHIVGYSASPSFYSICLLVIGSKGCSRNKTTIFEATPKDTRNLTRSAQCMVVIFNVYLQCFKKMVAKCRDHKKLLKSAGLRLSSFLQAENNGNALYLINFWFWLVILFNSHKRETYLTKRCEGNIS